MKNLKKSLVYSIFMGAFLLPHIAYSQDAQNLQPPLPVPTPIKVDFTKNTPTPIIETIPQNSEQALAWGIKAVQNKNITEARRLLEFIKNEDLKDALLWRIIIDENSDAGFLESSIALQKLIGFPNMSELRQKLEKNIDFYGLNNSQKIEFLSRSEPKLNNKGPITGEGKLSLALAYLENNEIGKAKIFAQDAWQNNLFSQEVQAKFLEKLSSILTTQDHDIRVNMLLWLNRQNQLKPLLDYVSPQMRINANIRLGIINEEGAVLSGPSLKDLGITYERVKNLRKSNRDSEALDLLSQTDWSSLPLIAQEDLWDERRRLLNEAIKKNRWNDAYKIISQHGLKTGQKAAEAEQTAGWIALRFLKKPQIALEHYKKFDALVFTGMSKSRSYYWQGRTYEEMGDNVNANKNYLLASNYPTFFYGQLAAARLGKRLGQDAKLILPPEQLATNNDKMTLEKRPLMRIARTFSEINERDLFIKFAFALDDLLETNGEHQALSEYARQIGENLVGIRVAKAGLNRGILATEAAFPVINIPKIEGYNQAEDAFSLAITRQESEFNPFARSKAGALGLMQFMPATAAGQAKKMGIPHQTSWLTNRPEHNLTLGSAHLADLTNRFYGSYILTIIAYNAGPTRSSQWIETYGEIRGQESDFIIDWIEKIPFSETRNYVHRVLENVQVYRARLSKETVTIDILKDLERGSKPPPIFKVKIMPEAMESQEDKKITE